MQFSAENRHFRGGCSLLLHF